MRLIGPSTDLERLMEMGWLKGMRDHVRVASVRSVPTDAEYRSLRRVQVKSSPERIRRRQMRRHGLTEMEALERVPDAASRRLNLPFVSLASSSTGQRFHLFLELGSASGPQIPGQFNAYGVSMTATVPWF